MIFPFSIPTSFSEYISLFSDILTNSKPFNDDIYSSLYACFVLISSKIYFLICSFDTICIITYDYHGSVKKCKQSLSGNVNVQLPRDHSGYVSSQWETTLQYNVVSHWLSPYPVTVHIYKAKTWLCACAFSERNCLSDPESPSNGCHFRFPPYPGFP